MGWSGEKKQLYSENAPRLGVVESRLEAASPEPSGSRQLRLQYHLGSLLGVFSALPLAGTVNGLHPKGWRQADQLDCRNLRKFFEKMLSISCGE